MLVLWCILCHNVTITNSPPTVHRWQLELLFTKWTTVILCPFHFFSKKLSEVQRKYSTYDRELLGAYLSVLHFKHLFEDQNVTLFTDHKPLVCAFRSPHVAKSDRQQRYWSFITEYITDVQYVRGSDNIVADCLSRPVAAVQIDAYDLPSIARSQVHDEETQAASSRLTKFPLSAGLHIWCDVSTPHPRPFLPAECRYPIFVMLHNISHAGVRGTIRLIKSRYVWPFMDSSIKQWVRSCTACQQSKITRHTKSNLSDFSIPSDRFETVHLDIVGPLPPATSPDHPLAVPYCYLLTCIDRATRWPEAIPLTNITAQAVAQAFLVNWISRYGVPYYVVTDRGSQFESELFQELSRSVGFHRLRTNAYHPQSNGMVERLHRVIKTSIMARGENWLSALPLVMLGVRLLPAESGFSPFTAMTGSSLLCPRILIDGKSGTSRLQNDFVRDLCSRMSEIDFCRISGPSNHSNQRYSYVPRELMTCEQVWLRTDRVRKPLEAPYCGPYKVVRRSEKVFVLEMPSGALQSVSIDRLKPAHVTLPQVEHTKRTSDMSHTEVLASEENASAATPVPASGPTVPSPPASTLTPVATRSGRSVRFRKHPDFVYF